MTGVPVAGLTCLWACLMLAGCGQPRPSKSKLIDAGDSQYWRGEYTEAVGNYKGALEHSPSDPDLLYRIGMCYSYQGEYREATYWFERALRSYPGHGRASMALEHARAKLGASAQPPSVPTPGPFVPQPPVQSPPDSDLLPVTPIEPSQPLTPRLQAERFIEVARRWEAEGDWEKALDSYQQAVESAPDQAFTHAALGHFYYARLGQNDKAIEHLQKARQLNPNEPGVVEDLAKLGAE